VVRLAPSPGHPAIMEPPAVPPAGAYPSDAGGRRESMEALAAAFARAYEIDLERRPFSPAETAAVERLRRRFKNLNSGDLSLNRGIP
jgi:hypothetical protein